MSDKPAGALLARYLAAPPSRSALAFEARIRESYFKAYGHRCEEESVAATQKLRERTSNVSG